MPYVNDTGLPSVTDILGGWIDRSWFKDHHGERGDEVHDVMAAHAMCLPHFGNNFNPLWEPYIESGKKWFDDNIKEVILVEHRLSIPNLYTGQLDLFAILTDDRSAIVDWKTSKSEGRTWRFQEAGYQDLVEHNKLGKPDVRLSVRLRHEYGRPVLVNEYKAEDYEYDLGIFKCSHACYREMNMAKRDRKKQVDPDRILEPPPTFRNTYNLPL